MAAAVAGGDVEACAAALEFYKPPKGRGIKQIVRLAHGTITVTDESYNASPPSIRVAISVLSRTTPELGGRCIIALGDMYELGEASSALHAGLVEELINSKIDKIFCCGEMMQHLYKALPSRMRGAYVKDSTALASEIVKYIRSGDVVAITIKGSKRMRMPIVVEAIDAISEKEPEMDQELRSP